MYLIKVFPHFTLPKSSSLAKWATAPGSLLIVAPTVHSWYYAGYLKEANTSPAFVLVLVSHLGSPLQGAQQLKY